ncbi:hypothetical protein OOU_Y34scaffold00973g4 [Pyricularia oryzae Y34]|nr:hypothetical protein OOU_Y34scaffold00973g4 [Pyricularia oryzae Y34]
MQFPSALIFGLLIQSAVAEPGHVSQQPGGCPAGQTTRINGQCPTGHLSRRHGAKYCPTRRWSYRWIGGFGVLSTFRLVFLTASSYGVRIRPMDLLRPARPPKNGQYDFPEVSVLSRGPP